MSFFIVFSFFGLALPFQKCYGVSISYLIICGQVMPQVILSFFKAFHKDVHEIPTFLLDRQFWILILMIVLSEYDLRLSEQFSLLTPVVKF